MSKYAELIRNTIEELAKNPPLEEAYSELKAVIESETRIEADIFIIDKNGSRRTLNDKTKQETAAVISELNAKLQQKHYAKTYEAAKEFISIYETEESLPE